MVCRGHTGVVPDIGGRTLSRNTSKRLLKLRLFEGVKGFTILENLYYVTVWPTWGTWRRVFSFDP